MKVFHSLNDPAIVQLLTQGAVGGLPSDTQYGLMCCAADTQAVERLYALKKRENNPGTVVAASTEQLVELGIKGRYLKAVEQFWPNAISVVLPCGQELAYLHGGKLSLAVRIPNFPELQGLLGKTGPLLTTSANHPGETPAGTIAEAQDCFGENVDFYVDGGDLSGRLPSTIIRMVDDAIEILRRGAVTIDESGNIL